MHETFVLQKAVVMGIKFIRLAEVKAKIGLSRSTIYLLAKAGKFPRPFKLSKHASAWAEDEVEEWQRERMAERQ